MFLSPESPLTVKGTTTTQQLKPETWIHPGLASSRCPPSPSNISISERAPWRDLPEPTPRPFTCRHLASATWLPSWIVRTASYWFSSHVALQSGSEKIVGLPCLSSWDTCVDLSFQETPFTSLLQRKHAGIVSRISSTALGSSLRSPLAHQQTEACFLGT